MKSKNELLEIITVVDYEIITDSPSLLCDWLAKNTICNTGFGQDYHSEDGTPNYVVYKLKKEDAIIVNNSVFNTVIADFDRNEFYLHDSYKEAVSNAELDGRIKTTS